MARVPAVDGPADGALVDVRGYYSFIDARGRHVAGPRGLYRFLAEPRPHYVFCEPDTVYVESCGCYQQRGHDTCRLCGASLPDRGAARTDR